VLHLQAESKELVEHAALLHDVGDWKYSGNEDIGRNTVQVLIVVAK